MTYFRNFNILPALFLALALAAGSPAPVFADLSSELSDAICNGDLNQVKSILRKGHGVNQRMGKDGRYPLELASYCYGGKPSIADYLIDRGANVNLHDDGYTALMWAIRSVDSVSDSDPMLKVVYRMMSKGAEVKYQDPTTGRTPLMLAASLGDAKLVKQMLAKGADRKPRTKGDWCVSDRQDIQCSASDYARIGGNVEIALELEGQSATAYRKGLHYAAKSGNLAQVKALIKNKADVNETEKLSGFTALYYATIKNQPEIVKALVQADANMNPVDFAGTTPLRQAVVYYKKDIARLLIDNGAKANHAQTQGCGGGMSEFGWAIEYGQHDLAKYMIEKGAIDPRNPGRAFQELYGKREEDVAFAQLLLEKGARPTQDDIDWLNKVAAANDWIGKLGYNGKIVAMLEEAMRNPAPETEIADNETDTNPDDMITLEDLPPIPQELFERRIRSAAPVVSTRSLKGRKEQAARRAQLPVEVRNFDAQFRDSTGKLDANPLR